MAAGGATARGPSRAAGHAAQEARQVVLGGLHLSDRSGVSPLSPRGGPPRHRMAWPWQGGGAERSVREVMGKGGDTERRAGFGHSSRLPMHGHTPRNKFARSASCRRTRAVHARLSGWYMNDDERDERVRLQSLNWTRHNGRRRRHILCSYPKYGLLPGSF